MSDKEIWLVLFHAELGNPDIPSTPQAARNADDALEEYKSRWELEELDAANP